MLTPLPADGLNLPAALRQRELYQALREHADELDVITGAPSDLAVIMRSVADVMLTRLDIEMISHLAVAADPRTDARPQ